MKKLVFAVCFVASMIFSGVSYAKSLNDVVFTPPLTKGEIAAYQKIGNNDQEKQRFIETRQFVRKVNAYVAELPKGVVYDPEKYGGPQPTANVNMDHALSLDEQLMIWRAFVICGGGTVTGSDEGFPITNNPGCGLAHPKQFDCGKPLDKNSVLSQLKPPASHGEVELFEKANACPSAEIPRFLATRKYMRQVDKLKGVTAIDDPRLASAPPIPELVNQTYLLSGDEAMLLLGIQTWQLTRP